MLDNLSEGSFEKSHYSWLLNNVGVNSCTIYSWSSISVLPAYWLIQPTIDCVVLQYLLLKNIHIEEVDVWQKPTQYCRAIILQFKKIRDTKGTFHAQMDTIKDRNGMDLTEAEDIKRWQEYTELYKKHLNDPYNHDGVITHLEPDILECKVKRALESIITNKANRGDGITAELF